MLLAAPWRPEDDIRHPINRMEPPQYPPQLPPARQPYGFTCPFCQFQGPPMQKQQLSSGGWVLFVVLLLFCLPLCWLPFVIDGCKETVRNCASCGIKLG